MHISPILGPQKQCRALVGEAHCDGGLRKVGGVHIVAAQTVEDWRWSTLFSVVVFTSPHCLIIFSPSFLLPFLLCSSQNSNSQPFPKQSGLLTSIASFSPSPWSTVPRYGSKQRGTLLYEGCHSCLERHLFFTEFHDYVSVFYINNNLGVLWVSETLLHFQFSTKGSYFCFTINIGLLGYTNLS